MATQPVKQLREEFYQEVYERNILYFFGCLCEAGYMYKFRKLVWESDLEESMPSEMTSLEVSEKNMKVDDSSLRLR